MRQNVFEATISVLERHIERLEREVEAYQNVVAKMSRTPQAAELRLSTDDTVETLDEGYGVVPEPDMATIAGSIINQS